MNSIYKSETGNNWNPIAMNAAKAQARVFTEDSILIFSQTEKYYPLEL